MIPHRRTLGLCLALSLAAMAGGCAVVKLPVKVAGAVVGNTIMAVTQAPGQPARIGGFPH